MQQNQKQSETLQTLNYVIKVFNFYGINYFTAEMLRVGKFPNQSNQIILKNYNRLLFDLCILQMSNYNINLKDYEFHINQDNNNNKHLQFIIYYLNHINCPYINLTEEKDNIFLDFGSQRDLLLILGWLMAISDIFDKYSLSHLNKLVDQTQQISDTFVQDSLFNTTNNNNKQAKQQFDNLQQREFSVILENKNPEEQFLELYNRVQFSFSKIKGLCSRKLKKQTELKEKMGLKSSNMKEFLLLKDESILQGKIMDLIRVNEQLEEEMNDMRYHNIFWQWMESVVDNDKKEWQNDPDYGFTDGQNVKIPFQSEHIQIHIDKYLEVLEKQTYDYEQILEKYQIFDEVWGNLSGLIKEDPEQIQMLQENTPIIIQEIQEIFPDFDKFWTEYNYHYKEKPNQSLLSGQVMKYLDFKSDKIQQKANNDNTSQELQTQDKNSDQDKLERIMKQEKQQYEIQKMKTHQQLNQTLSQLSEIIQIFPADKK